MLKKYPLSLKASKKVLVALCGGIAVYKACDLISQLIDQGYNVQVIMTESAAEFISPLIFKTLSKNEVYISQFHYDRIRPLHIDLIEDIELMIILPATANTLAKLAQGIADNLLTNCYLAYDGPVLICPAMNTTMWHALSTQSNLQLLYANPNICILDPVEGELACDAIGMGKLAPIEDIYQSISNLLNANNIIPKTLITTGGVQESIDPVRYIGNHSSGKMGKALADQAYKLKMSPILITTDIDISIQPYPVIIVKSTDDMYQAIMEYFPKSDICIMAAAVSDYKCTHIYPTKIKKNLHANLTLELIPNIDILKELGNIKTSKQTLIGFCAETDNHLHAAKEKIIRKNLDYIVVNDISRDDIGFGAEDNEVILLNKEFKEYYLPKANKNQIAKQLLLQIKQDILA